jgi:peptidoglycan/xylan/chitin deacetylase (PgdA/CDA1 family)
MRGLVLGLISLAMAMAAATPAAAEDVAITFDDLPTLSLVDSTAYARETTRILLDDLVKADVPAIGFVNEDKLEGADHAARVALLSQWLDAGMDLGNHSYSHLSLTSTPVDAYIADVTKGETVTRALLAERGRAPRYYRHPYLETGATPEARVKFEGWLADHGYQVAPVTMENSDWLFALPYDEAVLSGDSNYAMQVQAAYLSYTAQIVPWYRQAAYDVLGRRPAFVLLLHASRLNADSFDGITKILTENDLHPVTLEKALDDPAYSIADTYTGPDGDEWLTRWAMTLHAQLPWKTLPKEPSDISTESARLDALPSKSAPAVATGM